MADTKQLLLDFPPAVAMAEEDFIPFRGNSEALAWMTSWPNWPSHGLILHGARGSGKTHLAHIWARRSQATLISPPEIFASPSPAPQSLILENADAVAGCVEQEEALFHLLNHIAAQRGGAFLLLTAQSAPILWPLVIPDLRSRLLALPTAQIAQPDDATLTALIGKLFADRQLRVPAEVITYLARRIERSYAAACTVVARLDKEAMLNKQPVTLTLARTVLEQTEPDKKLEK